MVSRNTQKHDVITRRHPPKKIPCTRVQGINYFAYLGKAPTLQS